MKRKLERTLALAEKETRHLVRDRQALVLAIVMPLMLVLLFGFAVSFDVGAAKFVAIDRDDTKESRELICALVNAGVISVVSEPHDEAEIEPAFLRGEARGAIVIPPGYARRLARGEPGDVQLLVDGADGTASQTTLAYAQRTIAHTAQRAMRRALPEPLPIDARVRAWFNPELRSTHFVVPGLLGVVLSILAVLLSALTVAREWERGSMELLFSTPVGRLEVVLGKLLPYVLLGILQLLLVLVFGAWLFTVPFLGSFVLLLFGAMLFLVAVLGQGFLISTITKSQQVATQLGAISAILPSLLLSGFLFPIRNMPLPLRVISHAVPTRYLVPIMRGVMLKGEGLVSLWPNFLGIFCLAVGIVAACTLRFRRGLD